MNTLLAILAVIAVLGIVFLVVSACACRRLRDFDSTLRDLEDR
jgi:hypothetical protein